MAGPGAQLPDDPLPLLVKPRTLGHVGADDPLPTLLRRLAQAPHELDAWVHRAGAVLLRGFRADTPERFREVCQAIRPTLRRYVGGDSPRRDVADRIYTSTEYPAGLEVLLHNELSYAGWSPRRVFFGCMQPAVSGGETHLADGRVILEHLDEAIRERFETRGITYLQHLWDARRDPGPGKSWQETFETDDAREVERYLQESGMTGQWTRRGLRTAATHPAVLTHPVTGEDCWHNQADQWHREMDSVKDSVPGSGTDDGEREGAGVQSPGNHVTFGDGGEIDVSDLLSIRATSRACEVRFPWHAGDLLVLDNILTMHGRKPFTGQRSVLVAMA